MFIHFGLATKKPLIPDTSSGEHSFASIYWLMTIIITIKRDSDIAKWVEAACYILAKKYDATLSQLVEEAVTMIRNAQWEDGYINTYFSVCNIYPLAIALVLLIALTLQVVEPGKRWTNIACVSKCLIPPQMILTTRP